MNYQTTAVLLILLLVFGAYYVFVEMGIETASEYHQPSAAAQDDSDRVFVDDGQPVTAESVREIVIERDSRPAIVLIKHGDDWTQTQPVRFPVTQWSVDQVIESAVGLRAGQRLTPSKQGAPSLEAAQLSPPQAKVTLRWGQGGSKQRTIALGRRAVGGRAYAAVDGSDELLVVEASLHDHVFEDVPNAWRIKTIEHPTPGQADRVTLTQPGLRIELLKQDGRWILGQPHRGRADPKAVDDLLNAVDGVFIEDFVADQPADLSLYGLDQPTTALTVRVPQTRDDKTDDEKTDDATGNDPTADADRPTGLTLKIGHRVDRDASSYYATWTPTDQPVQVVFTIPKDAAEKFTRTVDDLRDRRVTVAHAGDVKELTLEGANRPALTLLRGPEGWSFGDPSPGYEADDGAVSDLVDAITGSQADSFVPGYTPAGAAVATIRLAVVGQPQPEVLTVYRGKDEAHLLVVRNDEAVGYAVAADLIHNVLVPPILLRERTVLNPPQDRVDQITLQRPDGTEYVFERNGESSGDDASGTATAPSTQPAQTWRLEGHDRFEQADFHKLRQLLLPLHARSWLIDENPHQDQAGRAHEGHTFQVTLTTTDGTSHTVEIDPDSRKGRLAGRSEWFEVSDDLLQRLEAEYRYRTVLPVKQDAIETVMVHSSGSTVTIRRSGDGTFTTQEASGRRVDEATAGPLFDTLAGLRAKRFVEPIHLPSDAMITYEVATRDGRSHRLVLSTLQGYEQTATLNGQWFTLDAQTLERLKAPLAPASPDQQQGQE